MGCHVSRRRRVSEGPDPHLPQWLDIYPAARLGGFGERPTAGQRDGFRGGASDPSQREPCLEAGGGAAPGGTPVCSRPTPRVRRGGTTDVQQLPGQPGCGVGTSPTGQSFARGRSSHGLRLGRHSSGRGEECIVQVGYIYVESALAQPIQLACA
jgi:hypothetical protein